MYSVFIKTNEQISAQQSFDDPSEAEKYFESLRTIRTSDPATLIATYKSRSRKIYRLDSDFQADRWIMRTDIASGSPVSEDPNDEWIDGNQASEISGLSKGYLAQLRKGWQTTKAGTVSEFKRRLLEGQDWKYEGANVRYSRRAMEDLATGRR